VIALAIGFAFGLLAFGVSSIVSAIDRLSSATREEIEINRKVLALVERGTACSEESVSMQRAQLKLSERNIRLAEEMNTRSLYREPYPNVGDVT
jgi:hypothetical protein